MAVTDEVPAVVGVPEMTPVEALSERPAGRPVAEKVYGVVPPDADRVRLTATPTEEVYVPGLASDRVVGPVQVASPDWAGTLTAFQAALTTLNSLQVGKMFLAACSVHRR